MCRLLVAPCSEAVRSGLLQAEPVDTCAWCNAIPGERHAKDCPSRTEALFSRWGELLDRLGPE